jgi:predicted transglutaminase-like cysteine proteinase
MTTQKSNSYSLAARINSDVNARVTYSTDLQQFGVPEFWQEAGKFGDCEDYALLKRALLLKDGWPHDKLFLACCWVETGEYHCVLIVDTDKGFFVLDNRYQWLMQPKPLPYHWDKALKGGEWCELSF